MADEWTVAYMVRAALTGAVFGACALGLTVLLLVTAPAFVDWAERELAWRRRTSFLRGMLVLVAFAGVLIVLAWLGRPFYGALLVAFAALELLVLMGFGVSALQIGKKAALMLNKPDMSPLVAALLGAVVIGASMGVPVLGWAVAGYFLCLGLGAVAGAIIGSMSRRTAVAGGSPHPKRRS